MAELRFRSLMAGSLPISRKFEIQVVSLSIRPEGPVEVRDFAIVEESQSTAAPIVENGGTRPFTKLIAMNKLAAALSRILDTSRWRDIESAPLDRELELAVIDGGIRPVDGFCLRHGD